MGTNIPAQINGCNSDLKAVVIAVIIPDAGNKINWESFLKQILINFDNFFLIHKPF